jgi:hypothetical protein
VFWFTVNETEAKVLFAKSQNDCRARNGFHYVNSLWQISTHRDQGVSRLEENVLARRVAVSYHLAISGREEIPPLGRTYGITGTQQSTLRGLRALLPSQTVPVGHTSQEHRCDLQADVVGPLGVPHTINGRRICPIGLDR